MSKSFIISICTIVIIGVVISGSLAEEARILPEKCVCMSNDEYDPVCGNNGITYPNLLTLRCANKCAKYSIHHMHHGPCKT